MRSCIWISSLAVAAFGCGLVASNAQSALPLPGCEATPEVRAIMDAKLDYDMMDKMKYTERMAYQRKVLEDLMARYPRELKPYESYSNFLKQNFPDDYAALRAQWVKGAKEHPDDALALLLAGKGLVGKDTPEAIRYLEEAKAKAPDFVWPGLSLASVYSTGKRADAGKMKENLEAFFAACPGSTEHAAQWLLNKDQPFQPKVAEAMRANLEKETDPKRLEAYETLWGLEFRTHPPTEHDAVRAQVKQDLARLEVVNPHGSAEWESFLVTGYKESGLPKETVTAKEDRLIHDYPHSEEAWEIVSERWNKEHPKPEDQTDKAAWTKYGKEYEEATKGWIATFTDSTYLQRDAWFSAISGDDAVTEKDGIAALDAFVQAAQDYQTPSWYTNYQAGAYLVNKKLEPARAIELVEQGKAINAKQRAKDDDNDNQSDDDAKASKKEEIAEDQVLDGLILKAAMQAGTPEPALKLKAELEAPLPQDKDLQSEYWLNRARLEAMEKHTQDALAYYQLAFATRTETPKAYRGKVEDDLTDEAHALWKAQGGTETAWALWSKPAGNVEQAAEGRWEKATKQIPDFALSDMNGKTWKLKELGGKTLLINLWATWCGPCQAELPALEKFYEKNKNRSDIQILTFDLDEDLGVLEPYLKEKGYTFPVLPAYSTVVGLLDGFAIPQTWLVDPHGVWQWKQIGFGGGSAADFEKEMMKQIDAAKGGE